MREIIMWNLDNYIKAWNFAAHAHQGQTMPGSEIAYINHIGNVTMEAMTAVALSTNIDNPDLLVQCALLHDVIEDTDCTVDEIEALFGTAVANGVQALSKNPDLPTKKAQMADSLARIKTQPHEIWMVKLADRITNLQPPPKHWTPQKIMYYRSEAKLIWETLGPANPYLANRLQQKIDTY